MVACGVGVGERRSRRVWRGGLPDVCRRGNRGGGALRAERLGRLGAMRFFAPSRDWRTDDARFEALFLRHYRRVHAILSRLLLTPEAVEDAVQEVFLRLYRQERL